MYSDLVMTNEELLREIAALPSNARRYIERYIKLFRNDKDDSAKKPRRPIREEAAFGIWKDREDMKEGGAAWVRNLRETHWKR